MKRLLNISPTFNPAARTVTFPASLRFSIKRLYAIINLDRDAMIYRIGAAGNMYSSISGNTVTLEFDTTSHNAADTLAIIYDDAIDYIPDDTSDATSLAVRVLPQKTSRISFAKAISGGIDTNWGTVPITGAGMTINQSGGNLVITSGTTARSETIIRSTESWKGGIRLRIRSTLSQRIINQNFFIEMVDVIGDGLSYVINSATSITVTIPNSPFTAENIGQNVHLGAFVGTGTFLGGRYPIASVVGNNVTFTVSGFAVGSGTCSVFGWNYYQLVYNGSTATLANFQTQRSGYANAAVSALINTTGSPGHIAVITGSDLKATLHDGLSASSTGQNLVPRANQQENIPDDQTLRVQVRVQNLATAPLSSTTWTIGFIAVNNYSNQEVALSDVNPMFVNGISVDVVRSIPTLVGQNGTFTVQPGNTANTTPWLMRLRGTLRYDDTTTPLAAGATFVGTARDTLAATGGYSEGGTYNVLVFSDVACTLNIEVSTAAVVWYLARSVAIAAGVPQIVSLPLTSRHYRPSLTNGPAPQGSFIMNSSFTPT
jgi:hypothetical protein